MIFISNICALYFWNSTIKSIVSSLPDITIPLQDIDWTNIIEPIYIHNILVH